eukprot:1098692-Prorocentrum_minimum.AAC.1
MTNKSGDRRGQTVARESQGNAQSFEHLAARLAPLDFSTLSSLSPARRRHFFSFSRAAPLQGARVRNVDDVIGAGVRGGEVRREADLCVWLVGWKQVAGKAKDDRSSMVLTQG